MGRQYFGTDGVRGTVGQEPLTVDFALRLASAAARVLAPQGGTVLIGKDTRLSPAICSKPHSRRASSPRGSMCC